MSSSTLVDVTVLSPNHSGARTRTIDRITPHCVVGQVTAESLGAWFAKPSTKASSNYGIDKDGRVGLYVDEGSRSWCSSSPANDQRAVTIECASEMAEPYEMRPAVYETLVTLCTDICCRNGKKRLLWIQDKDKALAYEPQPDEMLLTVHRWFAKKSCPGDWLFSRLGDLAKRVTDLLNPTAGQSGTFSDVPADHWAFEPVEWAAQAGIASGFPDGTFRPDEPVTRAQVMSFLYRLNAWQQGQK